MFKAFSLNWLVNILIFITGFQVCSQRADQAGGIWWHFREKERKDKKIICPYESLKIPCSAKGALFIIVVKWCYYDENEDVYKPVEGKSLEQKQDGSENIFLIDDSEVSEQVYNTRLKEIGDMGWEYGQTSEYDAEHYGCQTEDIIRAITEYQETPHSHL